MPAIAELFELIVILVIANLSVVLLINLFTILGALGQVLDENKKRDDAQKDHEIY